MKAENIINLFDAAAAPDISVTSPTEVSDDGQPGTGTPPPDFPQCHTGPNLLTFFSLPGFTLFLLCNQLLLHDKDVNIKQCD